MNPRIPIWIPDPERARATQMSEFMAYCERMTGERFPDYHSLHRFSVRQGRRFWRLFLDWSAIPHRGDASCVCTSDDIEQARFFPELSLNFAAVLLAEAGGRDSEAALRALRADGRTVALTRGELRERVSAGASALATLGLQPGAHTALLAFNDEAAVIAALSAAALGAAVASSAPEMGAEASVARLAPLRPQVLFCHGHAPYRAEDARHEEKLRDIVRALPSVRAVVVLDEAAPTLNLPVRCLRLDDLIAAHKGREFEWPSLPFNQPLYVLFSSGTTGTPKGIIHGAGGTLLEHLKEHRLHCDLRRGDRLFFQTSTGWMMWNWALSALASGVEIVLYDGAVAAAETLWRIVAEEQVTVFGTCPPYLQMCEQAGIVPRAAFDFPALRAVLSTGSILHAAQQHWFSRSVKELPIQSISGGTDIIGCFVLGNPLLPAYAGEPQCPGLGFDLRALAIPESANPQIGELVCASCFPSRPVGMIGDASGEGFHGAYFAQNPGVWTHGDLIELMPEGGITMHGRSDSTMKIRGIRIGPAEIYRVLESFPEIAEAMAVEQRDEAELGGSRLVLLLVLRPGYALSTVLQAQIRKAIGRHASAVHVPAVILQVRALPTTHTGKRSERSARDAVNGLAASNAGALRNPECLQEIAQHPGLRTRLSNGAAAIELTSEDGHVSTAALRRVWEQTLGIAPIGADDDIFALGVSSLVALRLLRRLEGQLSMTLPLTFIYDAPTVNRMVAALESMARPSFTQLVRVSEGSGAPFFIVHGLGGDVGEIFPLCRSIRCDVPVYAVTARGLDGESAPLDSVPAMAEHYLGLIRRVQPAGPYRLCGYSFGGLVAFEMAHLLAADGERVSPLILLDSTVDERYWPRSAWLTVMVRLLGMRLIQLGRAPWRERHRQLVEFGAGLRRRFGYRWQAREGSPLDRTAPAGLPSAVLRVRQSSIKALTTYRPRPYDGEVVLVRCRERDPLSYDAAPLWASLSTRFILHEVPGDHRHMVREPAVSALAEVILRQLREAVAAPQSSAPAPLTQPLAGLAR